MSFTSSNLRINDLSSNVIIAKDCKVNNCLAIASLIRRSQAQCRSSYSINLFKNFNMIFQLFSGSRHLGFEDIQAVVYLVCDPHKISSLLIPCSLHQSLVSSLAKLHHISFFPCNPLAPLSFAIQSVEVQSILRCNEATTLPSNEVLFDGFPVYIKLWRHIHSLYAIVHKVNASLNQ